MWRAVGCGGGGAHSSAGTVERCRGAPLHRGAEVQRCGGVDGGGVGVSWRPPTGEDADTAMVKRLTLTLTPEFLIYLLLHIFFFFVVKINRKMHLIGYFCFCVYKH